MDAADAAMPSPRPTIASRPGFSDPSSHDAMYPRRAPQLSLPAVSRSLALSAACLALLLSACGGSDKPKSQASTAAAPAEATAVAAKLDSNRCPPAEDPGPREDKTYTATGERLDPAKTYVATVDTNCGAFEITLDAERAPKTGGSFKYLADQGFYDGLLIHRIVPGFVFQGGDPKGDGTGGPGYSITERPPKGLVYRKGMVAMAKGAEDAKGSSGSQFFVVTGADGEKLSADYALLGKITGGQPIVDKIGAIITDPRTDYPDAPVEIKSIKVAES
jgi:peptidyl-prolyl cis-trans isomerase B (cyclophilin B)